MAPHSDPEPMRDFSRATPDPQGGQRASAVPATAAVAPAPTSSGATETFGALALRRYVKDDGRALILYERRARDGAAGNPGEDRPA